MLANQLGKRREAVISTLGCGFCRSKRSCVMGSPFCEWVGLCVRIFGEMAAKEHQLCRASVDYICRTSFVAVQVIVA